MKRILISTALSLSLMTNVAMAQSSSPFSSSPLMSADSIRGSVASADAGIFVPLLALVFVIAIVLGPSGPSHYYLSSDERLKTDIRRIGQATNGLNLYEFSYVGQPGTYRGVMAHEVQALFPHAVHEHDNGYLYVNYDAIGMTMERVN